MADRIEEVFTLHEYEIMEDRQSQIDPDKKVRVFLGVRCPRCKSILGCLGGQRTISGWKLVQRSGYGSMKCNKCGLTATVKGNALLCAIDKPERSADA